MKLPFFYILYEILLILPTIINVIIVRNKKNTADDTAKSNDFSIALILFGIFNFPNDVYSKIIIGAFFFVLLKIQYQLIKSKEILSLLFPSILFFNITTFSGNTKAESLLMIIYSVIGGVYLIKLFEAKKISPNEEKRYCIISGGLFLICKLFVFLLKIF